MPYLLTFCTSDLPGAATDADVFVTLQGSKHTSARICMPAESSDFARGQRDQFRLPLPDLGALQKLTVEHNNKGSSPAWHLDQVEVLAEQTGEFGAADAAIHAEIILSSGMSHHCVCCMSLIGIACTRLCGRSKQ